jgi:hypothetical protein
MLRAFCRDHGLTLAFTFPGFALIGISALFDAGWWRDVTMGVGIGALIAAATFYAPQRLRERGSPMSK